MARLYVSLGYLLAALNLASCEPCAVVLTGHCEERQHDEDKPAIYEPPGELPAPLYVPHSRG